VPLARQQADPPTAEKLGTKKRILQPYE